MFVGHFCPRCGLPTAAWAYRPPTSSPAGRSFLSILWIIAMALFLVLAATDFAGLLYAPTLVVPGIQGIESGQTVNPGLDFNTSWSFDRWGTSSSSAVPPSGGNPDGYLEMGLPASGSAGYWTQAFTVRGSVPFAGSVRLDVLVGPGLISGHLYVFVDTSLSPPNIAAAIADIPFDGPTSWTSTGRIDAAPSLGGPGTYFLKVGFVADVVSGPVNVGFDNVRLSWTTDAAVVLYIPLPTPPVVFLSQDKTFFLAYYGLVIGVILLAAGYYAIHERREESAALRAPLAAIGARLRSRSAWVAIAQVWMAVTFFQVAFILALLLANIEPTTPVQPTATNAWVYLYELANAGVYEELAFRVLLIGLPMALGSFVLRTLEVTRSASPWNRPGSAGKHIAGAWRYLIGGVVRSDAPRETLVAAWAFLFASSSIFGLAHAPGWGWWKVLPAMTAGLGFGYLFLRHGVGAAILAHFVNDYLFSLVYAQVDGPSLDAILTLLFFAATIAGSGFFAWYVIDGWRHFLDLVHRFRPPMKIRPALAGTRPYGPPVPPSVAPPDPRGVPPPGTGAPQTVSPAAPPPAFLRDPAHIPREYAPTYTPPPYGYPPVRFQCPSCGWVEARYDAGRFTCTRCGRTA